MITVPSEVREQPAADISPQPNAATIASLTFPDMTLCCPAFRIVGRIPCAK